MLGSVLSFPVMITVFMALHVTYLVFLLFSKSRYNLNCSNNVCEYIYDKGWKYFHFRIYIRAYLEYCTFIITVGVFEV